MSLSEYMGEIITGVSTIAASIATYFLVSVRDRRSKRERHMAYVRLFTHELQVIRDDISKLVEGETGENVLIPIEVRFITLIFDVLRETSMSEFKPENIDDVCEAYVYIYDLKGTLTTKSETIWRKETHYYPSIDRNRLLFILEKIDNALKALKKETL